VRLNCKSPKKTFSRTKLFSRTYFLNIDFISCHGIIMFFCCYGIIIFCRAMLPWHYHILSCYVAMALSYFVVLCCHGIIIFCRAMPFSCTMLFSRTYFVNFCFDCCNGIIILCCAMPFSLPMPFICT